MPDAYKSGSAPQTGRDPPLVQGELQFDGPQHVRGWCRRPQQPGARVAMELVLDGKPVVAMMAAQRFDGIGDGHHGFGLPLPAPAADQPTQVIEARDRQSGVVFGRLIRFPDHADRPLQARISQLERQLTGAADRVVSQLRGGSAGPTGEDLRLALPRFAARLRCRSPQEASAVRQQTQRSVPRLRLSVAPRVSVILPTGLAMRRIASVIMAIQPLFDAVAAELLVPDDGTDPICALLPAMMPGLRAMRVPAGQPVRSITELALLARGDLLAFIDAPPPPPWRWQPVRDAGRSLQIGRTQPGHGYAGHGFAAVLPRRLWLEIGGFDTTQTGPALWQNTATRCRLLGVPVREI